MVNRVKDFLEIVTMAKNTKNAEKDTTETTKRKRRAKQYRFRLEVKTEADTAWSTARLPVTDYPVMVDSIEDAKLAKTLLMECGQYDAKTEFQVVKVQVMEELGESI
jgi:ribosomal protein L32